VLDKQRQIYLRHLLPKAHPLLNPGRMIPAAEVRKPPTPGKKQQQKKKTEKSNRTT